MNPGAIHTGLRAPRAHARQESCASTGDTNAPKKIIAVDVLQRIYDIWQNAVTVANTP